MKMTDLEIAEYLDSIVFPCGCGSHNVWLSNLDFDSAIDWLRNRVPIYHMGMLGCCEHLRCINCDDMPSVCECGNYQGETNEE